MAESLSERIARARRVMGGVPLSGGLSVRVGTIVGLLAAGHSEEEMLQLYRYLKAEDTKAALAYAAWRAGEIDVPLGEP